METRHAVGEGLKPTGRRHAGYSAMLCACVLSACVQGRRTSGRVIWRRRKGAGWRKGNEPEHR